MPGRRANGGKGVGPASSPRPRPSRTQHPPGGPPPSGPASCPRPRPSRAQNPPRGPAPLDPASSPKPHPSQAQSPPRGPAPRPHPAQHPPQGPDPSGPASSLRPRPSPHPSPALLLLSPGCTREGMAARDRGTSWVLTGSQGQWGSAAPALWPLPVPFPVRGSLLTSAGGGGFHPIRICLMDT